MKIGLALSLTITLATIATLPDTGQAQTAATPHPGPSERPYGFSIELSFTPDALSSLNKHSEKVIVSASYYGSPTKAGSIHANEVGQIDLGSEQARVPAKPGPVVLSGSKFEAEKMRWVDGDVGVNVNVYTARLSSPDNLISCDFIDGLIANVKASQPVPLRCALISEPVEAKLKP